MPISLFANNPSTTVAVNGYNGGAATGDAPSPGTTETWTMTSSTVFPVANNSAAPTTQFRIADQAAPTEIILVTNMSGSGNNTWALTRGAESTTPVTHAAGATFYQVVTAGDLDNFKQAAGAAVSPVTVANSAALTAVAVYNPLASDLINGVSFEAIAFGTFAINNATAANRVMTWGLYWGGSGSVGGTYTPGTALCLIKTGTNAPLTTTTQVAGTSFDLNGSLTYISSTTATSNLNLFYTISSNSLTAAQATATATNATAGGASSSTAVTISGSGPIYLAFSWGGAAAGITMTATAPVIYRVA